MYRGYYVSSLRRAIDLSLDKEISLSDKEKPMLVVPTFNWSKVGQTIVVNGKPWKITEVDATTNAGISYCSLELGWISKSDDVDEYSMCAHSEDSLVAGRELELETEDAYFSASSGVEIIDIQQTKVLIKIPFGVERVVISTKQAGNIIENEYKVVIR